MMLKSKKLVALIAAITTAGALSAIPAFAEDTPADAGQNSRYLTFTVTAKDDANASDSTFKIGKDGSLYDEDGNKIESDFASPIFNRGSENGTDVSFSVMASYTVDENGNVHDEHGNKIELGSDFKVQSQGLTDDSGVSSAVTSSYTVDENGTVYDENGNKVDMPKEGRPATFTRNAYTVDENGNVYDEDGNKVNLSL